MKKCLHIILSIILIGEMTFSMLPVPVSASEAGIETEQATFSSQSDADTEDMTGELTPADDADAQSTPAADGQDTQSTSTNGTYAQSTSTNSADAQSTPAADGTDTQSTTADDTDTQSASTNGTDEPSTMADDTDSQVVSSSSGQVSDTTSSSTSDEREYLQVSASGIEGDYSIEAYRMKDTSGIAELLPEGAEMMDPIEITMTGGKVADTVHGCTVTLSDYTLADDKAVLFHIKDMDTVNPSCEEIDYTYDEKSKVVTFQTTSFSPFVFVKLSEESTAGQDAEESEDAASDSTASADVTPTPAAQDSPRISALQSGSDTTSIGMLDASLVSGAEKNDKGEYVWTADTHAAGHGFIYRVKYALSGTGFYDPGTVEIRVPKSILVDREGNAADTFDLSIPEENDPGVDDNTEFVYRVDGDDIVITNHKQVPAGNNGFFEISYDTVSPYRYADYGTEENSVSKPFTATLTINGQTESDDAEQVHIDTTAKAVRTWKNCLGFYKTWDDSWGEKPSDADNYYYLTWEVKTNISATQPYSFTLSDDFSAYGEVVGYKYSGDSVYSDNKVLKNQTADYSSSSWNTGRIDYVLTRISRDTYDPQQNWSVLNKVTATVTPADGVDAATSVTGSDRYYYEYPRFHVPTGHFWRDKYGLDYKDSTVQDSTDLRLYKTEVKDFNKGTTDTLGDFAYRVNVYGYPYPWTREEGSASNDPEAYGKEKVTYQITDDTLSLGGTVTDASGEIALGDDDYRITGIDISEYIQDAVYDETSMSFKEQDGVFLDDDVVDIYLRVKDSSDYVKAGSYYLKTKEGTVTDADLISFSESDNGKVSVAIKSDDVVGYRVTTSNAHYYTNLITYPHITLLNTEKVKAYTEANEELVILRNTMQADVFDHNGKSIFASSAKAADYAGSPVYKSELKKQGVYAVNHKTDRNVSVTWKASVSESNKTTGQAVEQQSGTFYDLLPAGAEYEQDSMKVTAVSSNSEETELAEGEYSIQTITNYKDSGRTMLIIQIDEPADSYELTYSTLHSYDGMADFGKSPLNTIAYETGNSEITDGLPDDGGHVQMKEIMEDLDKDTDAEKFLYAEDSYPIRILTAANLGLYKKIKAEKDDSYVTSTETNQDSPYSYLLRFSNDENTRAKDLILFDSLENYETSDGKTSDWHGILTGVNTGYLTSMGIAPVVYYSTKSRDEIAVAYNTDKTSVQAFFSPDALDDPDIWTTTAPEDMSTVTAVAIDCRKAADGSDYVLPKGKSLVAYLYMQSPESVPEKADQTVPTAYNNIYLWNTQISPENVEEQDLIHQDYTQITYRTVGEFQIRKIDQSTEKPIKGIKFHLEGTSAYGTNVDVTKSTNANGVIDFGGLERGSYTLEETEGSDDYQRIEETMNVIVDENGNVTLDGKSADENGLFTIDNKPRIHGDLKFYKLGIVNYDPLHPDSTVTRESLDGAVFKLEGESDYGNDILMYCTSDGTGKVEFDNIELGTYTLKETTTPDGYIPVDQSWTVTCNSNGDVLITDGTTEDYNGEYAVVNEPYHSFTIAKVNQRTGDAAGGAEFTLTGTSDYGTKVNSVVTGGDDGLVKFDNLEPGTYTLQETKAPTYYMQTTEDGSVEKQTATFQLDQTKRVVKITSDGKVTIDGLELNDYGQFVAENVQVPTGTVVVTKKWKDGLTGEEALNRPYPNIHISTMDPNAELEEDKEPAVTTPTPVEPETPPENTSEPPTSDEDIVASGTHGTVSWKLDKEGTLWLGAGTMAASYSDEGAPWYSYREQIKSIRNDGTGTVVLNSMSHGLFANLPNLEDISGLTDIDTSQVTDMDAIFINDNNLKYIDSLQYWDTGNVTDLFQSFNFCESLTNVDALSNWDVSNVTNMSLAFYGCHKLQNVNGFSTWDTSKVTSMGCMFRECTSLTDITGLADWDVTGVTTAYYYWMGYGFTMMFADCHALEDISPLSGWNTGNAVDMSYMFANCYNLKSADALAHWNTSSLETVQSMFSWCEDMESADFSGWNTDKIIYQANFLAADRSLKRITLGPKFQFTLDNDWALPNASSSDPYTGKWTFGNPYNHSGQKTASELMTASRNGKAQTGTWYWEKKSDPEHQYYYSDQGVDENGNHNVYDPSTMTEIPESFKSTAEKDSGYWTKVSDDTWTYTYYVLDPDVTWYVWEDDMSGNNYTGDYVIQNPNKQQGGDVGNVTNKTEDAPAYGSLELTKKVVDSEGNEVDDASATFRFTVTLTDKDGNALTGTTVYGNTTFTDGKADVILKAGESVTFTDIPVGYHYEIKETDAGSYLQEPFTNNSGDIGTTNETADVSAVCTNVQPDRNENGFTVTKTCTEDEDQTFAFRVELSGLERNVTYSYNLNGEQVTFRPDYAGEASLQFNLKNGDSAVFSGLPVESTYQVTEVGNSFLPSYTVTDNAAAGHISSTAGEASRTGESLSTAKETVDADELITVAYTNIRKPFRIPFLKQDDHGAFVSGAKLQILHADDTSKVIAEWTTEEDTIHYEDLPAGQYILHEAEVPKDENDVSMYQQAEDIHFSIGEDGTITVEETSDDGSSQTNSDPVDQITMIDEIKKTSIQVQKTDGTDGLAGAGLKVVDQYGETVESWTSDGESHEVKNLDYGETYTLIETDTPDGYTIAEDIEFEIDKQGNLVISGETKEDLTITMVDTRLALLPNSGLPSVVGKMLLLLAAMLFFAILLMKRSRTEDDRR